MIIRYAEEKNFIELRQFYDGMCKVLSGKDFLPEGDKSRHNNSYILNIVQTNASLAN